MRMHGGVGYGLNPAKISNCKPLRPFRFTSARLRALDFLGVTPRQWQAFVRVRH